MFGCELKTSGVNERFEKCDRLLNVEVRNKKTGAPNGVPVLSLLMQKRSLQVIALIRKRISR